MHTEITPTFSRETKSSPKSGVACAAAVVWLPEQLVTPRSDAWLESQLQKLTPEVADTCVEAGAEDLDSRAAGAAAAVASVASLSVLPEGPPLTPRAVRALASGARASGVSTVRGALSAEALASARSAARALAAAALLGEHPSVERDERCALRVSLGVPEPFSLARAALALAARVAAPRRSAGARAAGVLRGAAHSVESKVQPLIAELVSSDFVQVERSLDVAYVSATPDSCSGTNALRPEMTSGDAAGYTLLVPLSEGTACYEVSLGAHARSPLLAAALNPAWPAESRVVAPPCEPGSVHVLDATAPTARAATALGAPPELRLALRLSFARRAVDTPSWRAATLQASRTAQDDRAPSPSTRATACDEPSYSSSISDAQRAVNSLLERHLWRVCQIGVFLLVVSAALAFRRLAAHEARAGVARTAARQDDDDDDE